MEEQLQKRAFELAIEGVSRTEAVSALVALYCSKREHDPAIVDKIHAAIDYAYEGKSPPAEPPEADPDPVAQAWKEHAEIAAYNKRKVRKAMIMLKVNYKNADEDAVTDCLTDLQHYCNAKGIDYLTCEARAQHHFTAEVMGGKDA